MENNIVNVYGYIRVSTEGQVEQGYSLAEQRAEIEKYCSSKSYNLIEIFKDEGISGAKANEDEMSIERDGLLDMLASLKENKIQYIVVLSTNRLWRSDLVKVLLHRELKKSAWWQKIVCKCNRGKSGTKGVPVKTDYARYDIKKYIGVYESRRVQGQEGSGL